MGYRKILIPLDGSESAELALPYAQKLADKDTSLILFSVCPEDELRLCRLNSAYLGVQAKILEVAGYKAISHTEPGDLADRIKEFVQKEGVELIAVCRQGYSDLSREEKVLQNLVTECCSLLMIKPGSGQPHFKRILVPLDGTIVSEDSLPHVIKLAAATKAEVLLISVNAYPEIPSDRPPSAKPSWEEYTLILMREVREQAFGYLDRLAGECRAAGVSTRTLVVFGEVTEGIVRAAEDNKADLIAMATHARKGFGRWVFGSIATAVSLATEMPMLLVRGNEKE
jgi:nucleotide-binding universal stress UspA family protein